MNNNRNPWPRYTEENRFLGKTRMRRSDDFKSRIAPAISHRDFVCSLVLALCMWLILSQHIRATRATVESRGVPIFGENGF